VACEPTDDPPRCSACRHGAAVWCGVHCRHVVA
jgi:hypothetical protein